VIVFLVKFAGNLYLNTNFVGRCLEA